MEKIIMYKTVDNLQFENKEMALIHENEWYQIENKKLKETITKLQCDAKIKKQEVDISLQSVYKNMKKEILDSVPELSGIYMLVNPKDNYRKYIGSAVNLKTRYQNFLTENNSYGGKKIAEAKVKTLPHEWNYIILELCPVEILTDRENFYINMFDTIIEGYNSIVAHRKDNVNIVDKKFSSTIESAWKVFNDSTIKQSIYLPNKSYKQKIAFSHNITKQQFCEKRQLYSTIYSKEKIFSNFKLLTLNHNLYDYTLSIDDVVFIPQQLHSLITPRQMYSKNGLKTGVSYSKCEHTFTARIIDCYNKQDFYIKNFNTEQEAYECILSYKQKELISFAENNKTYIDESIYNILKSITIKQVEKLIMIDNKTGYEKYWENTEYPRYYELDKQVFKRGLSA